MFRGSWSPENNQESFENGQCSGTVISNQGDLLLEGKTENVNNVWKENEKKLASFWINIQS